jgi:molybdopterin-guanine dinucleotide biosynthesis protein A
MTVGGIVLGGGRSSRMGSSKALLAWRGQPLLSRVAAVVAEVASPVVVVHAPGQELPPLPPGTELAEDARPDRGPLEGLAAGLRHLQGRSDLAVVAATDLPFLHAEFLAAIVEQIGDAPVAAPVAGGRAHPLAAVYRVDMLPRVEQQLVADRLRVSLLLEQPGARLIDAAGLPHPESLRDVNDPDQLAAALADDE